MLLLLLLFCFVCLFVCFKLTLLLMNYDFQLERMKIATIVLYQLGHLYKLNFPTNFACLHVCLFVFPLESRIFQFALAIN